jgi:hypothetical protein
VATRRRGAALETALLDAAWAELQDIGCAKLTMEGVADRASAVTPGACAVPSAIATGYQRGRRAFSGGMRPVVDRLCVTCSYWELTMSRTAGP